MSDLKLLAKTMREFSDTLSDHYWQAGCAIEQLTDENEALRQERDQLKAELADARSCAKALEQEMNRARADERQAMHYLEQIRKAVAPDVDFPTLVRMCGELQAQTVDTLIDMSEGATIHQWRIAAKSYANQLRAKASEA